jgi:hypothetical protein
LLRPEFKQKYLVDEKLIEGVPTKTLNLSGLLSREQLNHSIENLEGQHTFVLEDLFQVPLFSDTTVEEALQELQSLSDELWSLEVIELFNSARTEIQNSDVLHARFGDLVTGEWRNFVEPTKYITGWQIDNLLALRASQGKRVILITDSPDVKKVFDQDEVTDFKHLDRGNFSNDARRLVSDLALMKYSEKLYAPDASAFSTLGAHIGGKQITKLSRERILTAPEVSIVSKCKEIWLGKKIPNGNAFVSRDLDQYVNCLSGIFSLAKLKFLTRAAYQADKKNVTAISHLAVTRALQGRFVVAERMIRKAIRISKNSYETHHDPLFLALSVKYLIETLRIISNGTKFYCSSYTWTNSLRKTVRTRSQLDNVNPYQFPKNTALNRFDQIQQGLNPWIRPSVRFRPKKLGQASPIPTICADTFPSSGNLFILNLAEAISTQLSPGH